MTEEIKRQVHGLYDSIMERPNQILRFFQDFFGEGRVDMRGFPSKDEFYGNPSTRMIDSFITREEVINSTTYRNMSGEDQLLVGTFRDNEEEWSYSVTTDAVLAQYFLPIMREKLGINDLFILIYFPTVRITNEFDKMDICTVMYLPFQEVTLRTFKHPVLVGVLLIQPFLHLL